MRFGRKARDEEPRDDRSMRSSTTAPPRIPTRSGSSTGDAPMRPVRRLRDRGPRRARLHRPGQPAGHTGRPDGDAAPGRRGERRGDRRRPGRRARAPSSCARSPRPGVAAPGTSCARGSPPRPPGWAARPPRSRAASAPSWSAWCRCRRPTARRHPGQPDQRPRGAELAAAGDADGPARGRAGDAAVPWEETIRQVVVRRGREAMAPGPARSSRCRPTPARRVRRPHLDVAPDLTTLSPCPSTRVACAPRSAAGRTRTATRPASCARTPRRPGWSPIADAPDREKVVVQGTLKTVTLRPRGGVPALEAELYDGSGSISVVWLGRRRIGGIAPGRGDPGRGPDRRPGRPADDVQPALRPEARRR